MEQGAAGNASFEVRAGPAAEAGGGGRARRDRRERAYGTHGHRQRLWGGGEAQTARGGAQRDGAPSSPPAHRKGHQAKRREQGGVARAGDTQFAPGSRVDATAAKHLRKDKAYYPGYVEPLKAKGVRYMQTVLTHYGGWHSGATGDDGFLSHVCHSGDGESFVAHSLEFYLTFFLVHPLVPRLRTPTRSGPWSA